MMMLMMMDNELHQQHDEYDRHSDSDIRMPRDKHQLLNNLQTLLLVYNV